jgi:hypothetical protein
MIVETAGEDLNGEPMLYVNDTLLTMDHLRALCRRAIRAHRRERPVRIVGADLARGAEAALRLNGRTRWTRDEYLDALVEARGPDDTVTAAYRKSPAEQTLLDLHAALEEAYAAAGDPTPALLANVGLTGLDRLTRQLLAADGPTFTVDEYRRALPDAVAEILVPRARAGAFR